MKRLFSVLLLCSMIFLLTGCMGHAEFYDLAICGSYGVPGMYADDLKGGVVSCDVIERDSYGRILFAYTAKSYISKQEKTAHVICQKYDSDYVYFYEDVCYLFADNSESDSALLKEINDWEKPLNEAKMSRRSNHLSLDLGFGTQPVLRLSEKKELCAIAFQVEKSDIETQGIVDCDYNGKELALISNAREPSKLYFALFDEDGTAAFLEILNQTVDQSQLTKFKQENGWTYGFQ